MTLMSTRLMISALVIVVTACEDLPDEAELRAHFHENKEAIETLRLMAQQDRAVLCEGRNDGCVVAVRLDSVDTTTTPPAFTVRPPFSDDEQVPTDRLADYAALIDAVPTDDLYIWSSAERFVLDAASRGLSIGGTLYRYVHQTEGLCDVYPSFNVLHEEQAERSYRTGCVRLEDGWFLTLSSN